MRRGEGIVQKRAVKVVLFDMDGVLIDSIDAWFQVVNDTLKHFGYKPFTFEYFNKNFGTPIEQDAEQNYGGRNPEEIADFYDKRFKNRLNKVKLFNGTIPTLKILKRQKIKIALITNSTEYITYLILNHFKIKKYFSAIVTAADVKHGKPSPDLIFEACKRLKVSPKNAILVGDSKYDMIAGRRAGCTTIGYKIKGDYKINQLSEVLKI